MLDAVWVEVNRYFTPRQATDIVLLTPYYLATASLIMAMGVEIELAEILEKELAWQRVPRVASGQVAAPYA